MVLTVASTTTDRDFEVRITLGDGKEIKGGGINFSRLDRTSLYPLIDGLSAKSASNLDEFSASKVRGKIVLCENEIGDYEEKFEFLMRQGVVGVIFVDDSMRLEVVKSGLYPLAAVSKQDGSNIVSYIKSTSNPMATILPTVMIQDYKPAPVVGYSSSRGPPAGINSLIKPDIAAPGVSILAAWLSNRQEGDPAGWGPPLFSITTGTSMACPHVSGLAARVKSQHPTWSPAAIRSAIMTTATQSNNMHGPITTHEGSRATPFDIGAGVINLSGALKPGLVYEMGSLGYLYFLCHMGYEIDEIKKMAVNLRTGFSCEGSSSISNINYPSIAIAISGLAANRVTEVERTVTNVSEEDSTYSSVVEAPAGLKVEVVPHSLHFTKHAKKLSFKVRFEAAAKLKTDLFGSITWANDKYRVNSPFVVVKSRR